MTAASATLVRAARTKPTLLRHLSVSRALWVSFKTLNGRLSVRAATADSTSKSRNRPHAPHVTRANTARLSQSRAKHAAAVQFRAVARPAVSLVVQGSTLQARRYHAEYVMQALSPIRCLVLEQAPAVDATEGSIRRTQRCAVSTVLRECMARKKGQTQRVGVSRAAEAGTWDWLGRLTVATVSRVVLGLW